MLPKLVAWAPSHFERYVEPFCGSACLFFALQPTSAVLADVNPYLISTYRTVRDSPDEVAGALEIWPRTKAGYLAAREEAPIEPVRAAARFIFLNRYAFNGVYRENRQGKFNVPFGGHRNGRLPTPTELRLLAGALSSATLECGDFEKTLAATGGGDFVYLDPPYHYGSVRNRGEYGVDAFSDGDVPRFIEAVRGAHRRGARILISYNRAHTLKRELGSWSLGYCAVRRSVAGFSHARASVREFLLRNY